MRDQAPTEKLTHSISTATTPHAVAQWRDNLSQVVEVSIPEPNQAHFSARLSAASIGHALFMETESCPQVMIRSPGLIRANEFDHLSLCVVQDGEQRSDQNDVSVRLKPGDVLIAHHARSSRSAYSSFKCLRLHLPRSMTPAFLRDRNVNGVVLSGSRPGTRLLTQHIEGVWNSLADLAASEITASVEAAFLIAAGSLQADISLLPEQQEAIDRTFKSSIQSFIMERLHDPRLGSETICATFHISKSKLYRLFELERGINSYITGCRLDRCWQRLRTGGRDTGPISSLAYASGFSSDVSFSRAFRRRFGLSPREVRDSVAPLHRRHDDNDAASSIEQRIMGWYRELAAQR